MEPDESPSAEKLSEIEKDTQKPTLLASSRASVFRQSIKQLLTKPRIIGTLDPLGAEIDSGPRCILHIENVANKPSFLPFKIETRL